MAEPDNNPSFSGLPLGVLELNVFIAGAEALGWLLVLRALLRWPALPQLPDTWEWWLAPVGLGVVLGLSLLGLAVEGLAGLTERVVTMKGRLLDRVLARAALRPWYRTATNHPQDWTAAQRWIWTSPQAAAEYARRRLRILVTRNTTFNVLVLTILAGILVWRDVGWRLGVATFIGGALLSALFAFVWLDANRTYHRAVADAGEVGRERGK